LQELGRTFGSFNLSAITGGVSIDGMSILKIGLILLLFKILVKYRNNIRIVWSTVSNTLGNSFISIINKSVKKY
jgi:Na+/H+-translocating membrane pyrophosphatase